MKSKFKLGLIILGIFLIAITLFNLPENVKALGTSIVQNDSDINTGTTTPAVYLTANSASSTIYATVDGSPRFGVNLCATASTSAGILAYRVFYTPQSLLYTASTTWYQETTNNLSGSTTASMFHMPVIHYVPLATSTVGTNYICLNIASQPINAKNIKIQMSMLGSNASVWRMMNAEDSN